MPIAPKELEVFGGLQRNLAQAAIEAVTSTVKTPWKEANLEICPTLDGTGYRVKILVIPAFGALIGVPTNKPILDLVCEIWKMRDTFDSPGWSGMKLSITSAGSCNIDFSYGPDSH
jgi:hypothetical protein